MPFLKKIAKRFLLEKGNEIHHYAFVFPTRRAGLYFQRHLQSLKKKEMTFWAPTTYSISDFIISLSGFTVTEPLELIFELYNIYSQQIRHYPRIFEDFYPWGKMIISDFDEIDKYMVSTKKLFSTLQEFKEVEDINKEEKADIYNKYTGFWEDMGNLYLRFNQLLKEKGKAYEGMIYRDVANGIAKTGQQLKETQSSGRKWQKIIFCGFNAFTATERTIVSHLVKEDLAEIYWDMDRYFVEDKVQEAGHFFRQNVTTFEQPEPLWVENQLAEPKKITLIGVQSKVSQAKVLGLRLKEIQKSMEDEDPEKLAVVLPDTAMLFPVLNSLPEEFNKINITIGYPLQQTPVFSLFDAIMEMQLRVVENESEGFYYKDLKQVLNHPYIKSIIPDEITEFLESVREQNNVYIKESEIELSNPMIKDLFKYRRDSKELMSFFMNLLEFIRYYYAEVSPDLIAVDYEYIYHFYTLMTRLKDSLEASELVLNLRGFRQLFADIVQTGRIPFTGEPLEGLQIMGMLETQTLDFDNLFILSVNEGHLPPGKSEQSFIPYDVRLIMGLPTYKDRDAITAYHFYRLLKGSRNITLIYTTETRGMERSEKSRFIDQLLIEYAERNKNLEVDHKVLDFEFATQEIKSISIKKTEAMLEQLLTKKYSPSSLLSFLTCSLKFYFTYVLRLFEEDEIAESPDYKIIGDIMHHALENLFQPYLKSGEPLKSEDFSNMSPRIETVLKAAFQEQLQTTDLETGRNRIVYEVLQRMLDKFLEKEQKQAGFRVLMLEGKLEKGLVIPVKVGKKKLHVQLKGTIDRMDEKDGLFRVIDYKTGKVNSLNLDSLDILTGADAYKRKEAFQLFFYRYLIKLHGAKDSKFKGKFQLGIYPFKKINDQLSFVKVEKNAIIDDDLLTEFEEILKSILKDLFDIKKPFTQIKEDEDACGHCPYVNICCRQPAEDFLK